MDGGWRAASMNGGAACVDAVYELKRVYECRVRSAEHASERAGDVRARVAAAAGSGLTALGGTKCPRRRHAEAEPHDGARRAAESR